MTEYVSLHDALFVADEFAFVLSDPGLLASALARPATSVFGDDAYPSLPRKAAALLESVVRNPPFVDGNKRGGWILTVTFLYLNGFVHDFATEDAFDLVVGVAEGRHGLDRIEESIGRHLIPRR